MPRLAPAVSSQVAQIGRASAQTGELNEMLRIEEELVHAPHLVNGDSPRTPHQVVEILESVLRPVTNMMEAQHAARVTIDNRFLEPGQLWEHKGVEHRAFSTRKRDITKRHILGRHLNNDHILVPLPGFLLRQTDPAYLIGRMQKVRVIRPVKLAGFTHDVASGRHPSFTSLEHLHGRTDQITNRIDVGYTRTHVFINKDFALLPYRDAQHFPVVFGLWPLTRPNEHEITWQGLLASILHIANGHLLYLAIALNRDRFDPFKNLHTALAHAIDYVLTQVFIHVMYAGCAHKRFARNDRGGATSRLEKRPILYSGLRAANDDTAARLKVEVFDQQRKVVHAV